MSNELSLVKTHSLLLFSVLCPLQIVSMCIALLPFSDMCPVGKLFQDVVLPK